MARNATVNYCSSRCDGIQKLTPTFTSIQMDWFSIYFSSHKIYVVSSIPLPDGRWAIEMISGKRKPSKKINDALFPFLLIFYYTMNSLWIQTEIMCTHRAHVVCGRMYFAQFKTRKDSPIKRIFWIYSMLTLNAHHHPRPSVHPSTKTTRARVHMQVHCNWQKWKNLGAWDTSQYDNNSNEWQE